MIPKYDGVRLLLSYLKEMKAEGFLNHLNGLRLFLFWQGEVNILSFRSEQEVSEVTSDQEKGSSSVLDKLDNLERVRSLRISFFNILHGIAHHCKNGGHSCPDFHRDKFPPRA